MEPPSTPTPKAREEDATGQPDPAAFDPVALSRDTLRLGVTAALATLDPQSGFPLATLINVATDTDGAPIFLASRLAAHTRNLDADGRASILIAVLGKGDPLATSARVSATGRAERTDDRRVRRRFLARHPKAALYADFADFGFFRLHVAGLHLNGGFARAAAPPPADVLLDLRGAEDLVAAEEGAVEHMNADHAEALGLYATRLLGRPRGAWRASGIDPEGMDLVSGAETARLLFPERVRDAEGLRRVLVDLAGVARART